MKPKNKITDDTETLEASKSAYDSACFEEKLMEPITAHQNVEDPSNSSNQMKKFFEISESFIYEDVPENENILETLLTKKNFEPETYDLDKNNSDKTEPASKTQSPITEHHKIYSSCRMYTRKSNVSKNMSGKLSRIGKEPNTELNGGKVSSGHQTRVFHVRFPRTASSSPESLSKAKESVKIEMEKVMETITSSNNPALVASSLCNSDTLNDGNSFHSDTDNLCNGDKTEQYSNRNMVQYSSSNFQISASNESKPSALYKKLNLMHARVTLTDIICNRQAFKERLKDKRDISYVNQIFSSTVDESGETNYKNTDFSSVNNVSECSSESKMIVKKHNRKKGKVSNIDNLVEKLDLIQDGESQFANDISNKISTITSDKSDEISNQNVNNLNQINNVKNLPESKRPVNRTRYNTNKRKFKDTDNYEEQLVLINSDESQLLKNGINNKICSKAVNKSDETTNQNLDNLDKMNDAKNSTQTKRPVKKLNRNKEKCIDNVKEKLDLINSDEPQLPNNGINNKISSTTVNKRDKTTNQYLDNLKEMNDAKISTENRKQVKKHNRKKEIVKDIDNMEENLDLVNNGDSQLSYKEMKNEMSISSLEDTPFNYVQNITDDICNQNPQVFNNKLEDGNLAETSKNINTVQNGKENISKNSLNHMGASMRYGQEIKFESNLITDKCNKLISDEPKHALFNGTCDNKNSEKTLKTSSRAHLSIVEMFKRYTDKSNIFSNPSGLPEAQGNLIQNMLANSYLPKNSKKPNKLLSFNNISNTGKTDLPPNIIETSVEAAMPFSPNNIESSIETDMLLSPNNEESKERNKSLPSNIRRDSKKIETECPELLQPSTSNTYDHINSECLNVTLGKKYKNKNKLLTKTIPVNSTSAIVSTSNNRSSFRHRSRRSTLLEPIFNNSTSGIANTIDVDNKLKKGDIENKSSNSNAKDVTNTAACQSQSSIADNSSPQKNKKSVKTLAPKRGRRRKDMSDLSLNPLLNLTNNSTPLIEKDNKSSRNINKKPRKTVRTPTSSRMQTRTSAKSDTETKSVKIELSGKNIRNKSCSPLENAQKLSRQKRQRSHSMHSLNEPLFADSEVVNSKTVTGALNEETSIPSIRSDFDSTIQIKRRKRSASVEPKSVNILNQDFNASLKRNHSLQRRNIRSKSVEPMHVLNMHVTSQDKFSNKTDKRSDDNGSDINSVMNSFNSAVKSTRRRRSASVEPKLYVSNQVTKGSLKRKDFHKSVDKASTSLEPKHNLNVHVASKNKAFALKNQQKFKNRYRKHSSTVSEPFNIVIEPHEKKRSFSSDSDSLNAEVPSDNFSTETQFNEQNRYQCIPFPVQTLNTQVLNSANNPFIYGNPIVQYPQLLNQRVFPNLNQLVTQSQNPYYGVQNTYGNFNVPSFNIISPQSGVTYPIYQNRPTLQSSNFSYNAPSNANFGFQSSSLVSNAPSATNLGLNSNCSHLNFPGDTLSRNNLGKSKRRRYFIHNSDVTSHTIETTTKIRHRPKVIKNFDEKLKEHVEGLKQACFFKMHDNKERAFSRNFPVPNLTVKEFYSNSLVLNTLRQEICEMIPDFDFPPKVEYIFEDSFFDSSMREVMKDYVDFHLQSLYTKPSFKDHFVSAAYKKFPFRDCSYLCQAFPHKNETIDFKDLICYLNCASLLAILDECKKRNLVQ